MRVLYRQVLIIHLINLLLIFSLIQSANASWQLYRVAEFNIEFLALSPPHEQRVDAPDVLKVIWHIGFMDDGTNGAIDATRLKDGSLRFFSVTEQANNIRKGMEKSKKSKIVSQKNILVNGVPAVEFRITSTSSRGTIWYGVMRALVIEDTIYSVIITCPNEERTNETDIVMYLNSLKRYR